MYSTFCIYTLNKSFDMSILVAAELCGSVVLSSGEIATVVRVCSGCHTPEE